MTYLQPVSAVVVPLIALNNSLNRSVQYADSISQRLTADSFNILNG